MTVEPDPRRAPTTLELAVDLVKTRMLSIVGVLLGATALWLLWGQRIGIPRQLKVLGFSALFLAPWGYIVGQWITGLLWSPSWVYVDVLRAEEPGAGQLVRMPYEHFRDLEVVDGDLDQEGPNYYRARDLDLEERRAEGLWRGTLTDRELMIALSKVDECRGQLQEDAKRGFALRTQAWTIVRSCVRSATLRVVETFEKGTLPDDGESIGAAVDDALEQYDLEEQLPEDVDDVRDDLGPADPAEDADDDLVDEPSEELSDLEVPADD